MSHPPRTGHPPGGPPEADLLDALLRAPPPDRALAPVALRSTATQRDTALDGWQRKTWVDTALRAAEVLFLLAAVGLFLRWAYQGPVGNWLHAREVAAARAVVPTPPLATLPVPGAVGAGAAAASAGPAPAPTAPQTPAARAAAALPYTVPEPGEPSQADLAAQLRRGRVAATAVPAETVTPLALDAGVPPAGPAGQPAAAAQIAPTQPLDLPPASVPPDRLQIPALGLDTAVKETFVVDGEWEVAQYAAGFMSGTALPGAGNTALAGHAGLYGGVFADLGALTAGDEVLLDAGGTRFSYRVRELTKVEPTTTSVLNDTAAPVLTLLTCTDWDTRRLVVIADLVAKHPAPREG